MFITFALCLTNFAHAQDSSRTVQIIAATAPRLALSVVTGDYQYWALAGNGTGNYLVGGFGFTRKLNAKLSAIGGVALQTAPETGAWGPNMWLGLEKLAGPFLADFFVGGIKDAGSKPSPWILGPGINLLFTTKSGAFGPMIMATRAITGGPWFFIFGVSASGSL